MDHSRLNLHPDALIKPPRTHVGLSYVYYGGVLEEKEEVHGRKAGVTSHLTHTQHILIYPTLHILSCFTP